ncbi:MAG TPA: VOC family protein [Candidatus Baltobacteraceae bacterium]|nr:VOC family protein [Candidatus Baltobacteraceae bacterium]
MKDVSLIIYPATDLDSAKRFFRELVGADPYVDSPQYVGYKNGDMEIGLIPNYDKREPGGLAYWTVGDIAAEVKALVNAGGTIVQDVTDVAYGLLVASVKEPNGSIVGLRQPPKK